MFEPLATNPLYKLIAMSAAGGLFYLSYNCPCDNFINCEKPTYFGLLFLLALLPFIK